MNHKLQQLIEKEGRKSNTHSVLLGVKSGDGRVDFCGAAGEATPDHPYFIASITKMYTAAVVMQLVDNGQLDLEAPIRPILSDLNLEGIHRYKGADYTDRLTVRQLLHQTSGLADYYEGEMVKELEQNKDFSYSLDDVLTMVREMETVAEPDSGKSYYSDTNFQLLGAVIERVAERPLADVFASQIFDPLGLTQTSVFNATAWENKGAPLSFYNRSQRLHLPQALSCMAPDGGIVSTLDDQLRFLVAFFGGELFPSIYLPRMQEWNRLFFPLQYGYGLMRFKLPRWMNLFRETPELIGHSGSTGSFAFYSKKDDLYLVGTFNQIDKPQRPFGFMMQVLNEVRKSLT